MCWKRAASLLSAVTLVQGAVIDDNSQEKSCYLGPESPEEINREAEAKKLQARVSGRKSLAEFWQALAESPEFTETFWQQRPVLLDSVVPPGIVSWSEVQRKKGFRVTTAASEKGQLRSFSTEELRPGKSIIKKIAAGRTALIGYDDPQLCGPATASLGLPCSITVYTTGIDRLGVPAHWDMDELFVMQAEGSKNWRIFKPLVPKATAQLLGGHRGDVISADHLVTEMTIQLHPGDVLYIPRGLPHDTHTPKSGHHEAEVSMSLSWSIGIEMAAYYNLLICARHQQQKEVMAGRKMMHWTVQRALAEHEDILTATAKHDRLRQLVPAGFEAQRLGLKSKKQLQQAIKQEALDLNDIIGSKINRSHIVAASSLWADAPGLTNTPLLCEKCGRCPVVPKGRFDVSTGEGASFSDDADSDPPFALGQLPNRAQRQAKAISAELLRHASKADCRDAFESLMDASRLQPKNVSLLKILADYVWRKATACKAEVCGISAGSNLCVATWKWRRAAYQAIKTAARLEPDDDHALVLQAGLIFSSAQDKQFTAISGKKNNETNPFQLVADVLQNATSKGELWGSRAALMRAYLLHGMNESKAAVATLEPYLKGNDAELLSAFGYIMGMTALGSIGAVRFCWSRAVELEPDSPAKIYTDSLFHKVVTSAEAGEVFASRRDLLFHPGNIPQLGHSPPKLPPAELVKHQKNHERRTLL